MARRHRTIEAEVLAAPRSAAPRFHEGDQATDHFGHALLGAAAALLVARPLVPSDGGAWTSDGQVAAALWIALAALWVVQSLSQPRLRVRFGWIDAAMVAFVGWWSAAALMGSAHAAPRPSINMLWQGVAILLTYLLLRQLVDNPRNFRPHGREARALVAVMIAVGVCLAITAIYQYFVLMPATRRQFVENPAAMFRAARLDMAAPGTREFRRFADRLNSPEPTATFDLTNSLAAYLAPWLVIAMGIAIFAWRSPVRSRRDWLAALACAVPIACALALTHSRSAWIGTVVGFVCLALRRRGIFKPSGRFVVIAVCIIAILGGIAIAVRPQFLQRATYSFHVRLDYWRATCAMIADRPWWGCGPGNFDTYYTQYKLPAAFEEIKDPHDFALEIASNAGLPALVLFLAVVGGFAVRLWKRAGFTAEPAVETLEAPRVADGAWWIFGGAMLGLWIAFGWNRFIAGYPAWEEEAVVRMFVLGIVWWLLWPWIDRGTLSPRLCGLGVLVLLVALLAVGGITFGGVNETLWLLLALGLNANGDLIPDAFSLPWAANLPLLAIVIGLWYAQHQTAYAPTLACQGAIEAAEEAAAEGGLNSRQQQEQHLAAAAEADPYAVEPRRRLASLRLEDWLHGDKQGVVDFEHWTGQALAIDPRSAPLLSEAATGWRIVFMATNLPADGRKAVEYFRQAVELYPSGVAVHFQLAQMLAAMGDSAAAKDAAREAIALDDLRPKTERALADEQRKLAERIILGDNLRVTKPSAVRLGPPAPAALHEFR